jgi:hypothetical protein
LSLGGQLKMHLFFSLTQISVFLILEKKGRKSSSLLFTGEISPKIEIKN